MNPPVPTTLVIGLAGAGKSAFIRSRLAARPAGESWLWLNNDLPLGPPSDPPDPATDPLIEIADLTVGCACCAALPVLRTRLPRWLAQRPRHRLLVEMAAAGDPAAMIDALRLPELARWLNLEQAVLVADARQIAGCLDPAAVSASALLARRQLAAADSVWLTHGQDLPETARGPLVEQLACSPPFGRPVHLAGPGDAWCAPGQAVARRQPLFERRWPADWRFDRRRLLALFDDTAGWAPALDMAAVFATERAWYAVRRQASRFSMEVSAYRSESRLQVFLSTEGGAPGHDIGRLPDELDGRLQRLVQAIEAARLA